MTRGSDKLLEAIDEVTTRSSVTVAANYSKTTVTDDLLASLVEQVGNLAEAVIYQTERQDDGERRRAR